MDWLRRFTKSKRFNPYDTTAIKQELDKAILSVVLSDKDFSKNNLYTDLKIALGIISLGMAVVVYLFSCPAQSCQLITWVSVLAFFVLSLLGPWVLQSLEKKAIVIGTLKKPQNTCKIRIETQLGRYDNNFEVTIKVGSNSIPQKYFTWTVPYNRYFNNKETFLEENFQASFQKFYEDSKTNTS